MLMIGAAVVVVVALGGAGILGVRAIAGRGGLLGGPPTVKIVATPNDAKIVFASVSGTGTATARDVKPGTYTVKITRTGFKTVTKSVNVERGKPLTFSYTLEPMPTRLVVDVRPDTAKYEITASDGSVKSGTGSYAGRLPAGPTKLTVSAEGCRPVTKTLFLDSSTKLSEWLDPSGQLVHKIAVFKTVPAPKGVSFTPDGTEIWTTALVTQPSIEIQDPNTGTRLGAIDLGKNGAVEVTFNKAGTRAYASQMQSASVYEIDVRSRKVLRQMSTGSSWTKIVVLAPDEKSLFAANWSGDDVSWIDVSTGRVKKRFPTVDTPRGMYPTPDGARLFVAGFGEQSLVGRIAVIDLATGRQKLLCEKKGSAMRHMVADPRRGIIFTSDLGKDCIWVTDEKTLKTTKFVDTDVKPNTIDLTPDGKVLVVSCRGENNPKSYYLPGPEWGTVLLFDAHTGKPLDAIIGGDQCTALDLSDDGTKLVFSDFLQERLHSYEIPPYDVLAAGNGGRYLAHFAEIVKPEWKKAGWKGPRPPAGN